MTGVSGDGPPALPAATNAVHTALRSGPVAVAPLAVDDGLLIERCRARDEIAAEELVARFGGLVYGIGLRLTSRREDAEDLVQEVFLRVFRALPGFRGECSLKGWIAGIAVNAARNRLETIIRARHRFGSPPGAHEEEDEDPMNAIADDPTRGPEAILLAGERRKFLLEAIAELPREYREAVILRDQNGLAYDEIAAATGVPVGTVRSRLARGRALLAKKLQGIVGTSGGDS